MSESVGEQLKSTRIGRGLSLEQAAQTTRIRQHYLEALEHGDREALPSAVQGRGFLRLYAGYLNLPAEALVAEWEGRPAPQPAPAPEPPPLKKWQIPPPPPPAAPEESSKPESPQDELPAERAEPVQGSSRAIFAEIGRDLQSQRESLGVSLDEVERHTRMRQHYLSALEAGSLEDLPSTVQARGMLSNYAVFLNMDSERLLLRFAEGLQLRRTERLPPTPQPDLFSNQRTQPKGARPAGSARKWITADMLFVGGLILILFVFIVWTAARISSDRSRQVVATLPSVGEVLLYTSSPEALTVSPTTNPAAVTETPAQAQTGTPPPAESSGTPAASGTALGGIQIATLGAINTDPVQLYIIARRRSFLRVTIDGQIKFNGRTVPGSAYPFSAQKTIEILVGDAAALQVFYNQRDLGNLGSLGQVINLSFTHDGVQTPTATITPTASATPLVSTTPTPGSSFTPSPSPTITPLIP